MREDIERNVLEIIDHFVGSAQCGYVIEKVTVTLYGVVMYGSTGNTERPTYAKLQTHLYIGGSIGEPWVVHCSFNGEGLLDRYLQGWESP